MKALVLDAMRRFYYRCEACGETLKGARLKWPAFWFNAWAPRLCENSTCAIGSPVHDHVVQLGPFPPHSPVCPCHRVDRAA